MAKQARPKLVLDPPTTGVGTGVVAAVAQSGSSTVDARTVAISPRNPRARVDENEDLASLTESVRRMGVIQPVVVVSAKQWRSHWPEDSIAEDAEWVALAGNRRLAAAKAAGRYELPVVVRDDLVADEASAMLTENMHRLALTPIEEAQAYQRLVAQGRTQTEIAGAVAVSQGQVAKRLALLKLGEGAQKAVHEGRWTVAQAAQVMKQPAEVQELIEDELDETTEEDRSAEALIRVAEARHTWQTNLAAAATEAQKLGCPMQEDAEGFSWQQAVQGDLATLRKLAAEGDLVVVPTRWGAPAMQYYRRTMPQQHKPVSSDASDRRRARVSRLEFLRGYAAQVPGRAELHRLMVDHVLGGLGISHDSRTLAGKILQVDDPGQWLAEAQEGSVDSRNQAAWVVLLAVAEANLGAQSPRWNQNAVEWMDRFIADGYVPTSWEAERLEHGRSKEGQA